MASDTIAIHKLLGPRATPPFLVRFGVWFVIAILAVTAIAGSFISYRDHVVLPVEFATSVPIRSQSGSGRIRLLVTDGALVGKDQPIARLELVKPGVAIAVTRVPAPLSDTIKRGDLLVCETDDANGVHRQMGSVDAVLSANGDGIVVRVLVAGRPAKGFLTVVGREHSVLYRLISSLFQK